MNQRPSSNSMLQSPGSRNNISEMAPHKKIFSKYTSNNVSLNNVKTEPSKNEKRLLEIKKQIVEKRLEAFGIGKAETDDRFSIISYFDISYILDLYKFDICTKKIINKKIFKEESGFFWEDKETEISFPKSDEQEQDQSIAEEPGNFKK